MIEEQDLEIEKNLNSNKPPFQSIFFDYLSDMKIRHADQKSVIESIRNRGAILLTFISIPFFQVASFSKRELPFILMLVASGLLISIVIILLTGILCKIKFEELKFDNLDFQDDLENKLELTYFKGEIKNHNDIINKNDELITNLSKKLTIGYVLSIIYIGVLVVIKILDVIK